MHGGVDRDLAAKVVLKLLILDRRRSVVRQQLCEALRGIKAQLLDRGAAVERCGDGALRQRNESDLALESPATWMPILRAPYELELLLPRLGVKDVGILWQAMATGASRWREGTRLAGGLERGGLERPQPIAHICRGSRPACTGAALDCPRSLPRSRTPTTGRLDRPAPAPNNIRRRADPAVHGRGAAGWLWLSRARPESATDGAVENALQERVQKALQRPDR